MAKSSGCVAVELSDRTLMALGGPEIFRRAKSLAQSGAIHDASFSPPVLRATVCEGSRSFRTTLHFQTPGHAENLCPCRDSRVRGIICHHAIAAGLAWLHPSSSSSSSTPSAQRSFSTKGEASPPARKETREEPQVSVRIDGSLRAVEAEVVFQYTTNDAVNADFENNWHRQMDELGLERADESSTHYRLSGEEKILRLFASGLPKLRRACQVVEGERFQHTSRSLVRVQPVVQEQRSRDGWLDLRIHHQAGEGAILSHADLLRLLQSGRRTFPLAGDRVAVVDDVAMADLEEVLRDCDPVQSGGGFRIQPRYAEYWSASSELWGGSGPQNSDPGIVLGTLEKDLRPYQVDGARWMLRLARTGLGGLLADEMGLGKTIQTLAMVESLGGPVLVLCPSSLVWNWQREARRFLPSLQVLALDGPKRAEKFSKMDGVDLVITSYALLRRDQAAYANTRFRAVILDEAQHIKNPDSQNARAARGLKADSRFILTGTPLENTVRDLWSLVDFVLPGYLGGREDFRERYEIPLSTGNDVSVRTRLRRRLAPYLLRREKRAILHELPPKIEQVIEIELSAEQRKAYTEIQDAARSQISQLEGQKASSGQVRMRVLAALLRLRQVCCDLGLLGHEPKETSSKLAALRELLQEAMDGGHRTLVFSQFTSMLDRIEPMLREGEIDFCRLDGNTRDRQKVVDLFQQPDGPPVFLISLKAGGSGLNLTAADTVIHFDPWWNPAVEAQATDRAHRIGQSSVVTSIKLIASNTVEERVLRMQQEKQSLFDGLLDSDSAWSAFDETDLKNLLTS